MGAEVAAVESVAVSVAALAAAISARRSRAPREARRGATVLLVAAVTGEASAAVAVSAARRAPWSS